MKIGQTVYTINWLEIGHDRLPVKVSEEVVTGILWDSFIQTNNKKLNRRQDVFTIRAGAELEFKRQQNRFQTDYWRAVSKALKEILK